MLSQKLFWRAFAKFFSNIQVDTLCTYGSRVIDVGSFMELLESKKSSFAIFLVEKELLIIYQI